MYKIRIGNDIVLRWRVLRGGQPETWEGKTLDVSLYNPGAGKIPLRYEAAEGGMITAYFPGSEQRVCGQYTLTLVENPEATGMAAVDSIAAFRLVPRQNRSFEMDGCGCQCGPSGLQAVAVGLESELACPCLGRGAVSIEMIDPGAWGKGLAVADGKVQVRLKDGGGINFDADGSLYADGAADVESIPNGEIDEIVDS